MGRLLFLYLANNTKTCYTYDVNDRLISRTGTSDVIFGYNGRDGVVTDDNGLIYMRARYYSPDMKRFINADIVPGEISNAVTLNRFAYANGNPVSFVDPFGLSVLSWLKDAYNEGKEWVVGAYNDVKDYAVNTYNNAKKVVSNAYRDAKEWVVNTYQDFKDSWKNFEDQLLNIESEIMRKWYGFDNNKNISDYTGGVIKDQDNVAEYTLGKYSLGDVGCEVVAVYNVMALTGYSELSLLDTIETFENQGALILQAVLKGGFGSNPHAISRVLDAKNIGYNKISNLDALKESGIYIVSYWNSMDFNSMIHTVAIEVVPGADPSVMNASWEDVVAGRFITGYEILGESSNITSTGEIQKYNSSRK